MSDYSKSYDGAAKDAAIATITGADFDTEFSAIETAIGTKANKTAPSTAGNVATLSAAGDLQDSGSTLSKIMATHVSAADGGPYFSSTIFDVAAVIGTAWESVGPTGSGATNIWTALDTVPTDVDWIEVKITMQIFGTATASTLYSAVTYARKNGSSVGIGGSTKVCEAYIMSDSSTGDAYDWESVVIKIPVSSRTFDLYLGTSLGTTSLSTYLYLTGYGYNP